MSKRYDEVKDFLLKRMNENQLVFNMALSHILIDGIDTCKEYDLEKIEKQLTTSKNDIFSKDIRIDIYKLAKEISLECDAFTILTFYKELVPVHGIPDANKLKAQLQQALVMWREENLETFDSDEDWIEHVCNNICMEDYEYEELMGE